MIRNAVISTAVGSVRGLNDVIQSMTEAELEAALELEAGSQRRKALLRRLIQRLTALRSQTIKEDLTRRYM